MSGEGNDAKTPHFTDIEDRMRLRVYDLGFRI